MSLSWDIGFRTKPELSELDQFMESLGFQREQDGQRVSKFLRVYVLCNDSVGRAELFYEVDPKIVRYFFSEREGEVQAYGDLNTNSREPVTREERIKSLQGREIRSQHDYYRYVEPGRLKWYETALALRDHYNAIVKSEQTGDEIDPEKEFWK